MVFSGQQIHCCDPILTLLFGLLLINFYLFSLVNFTFDANLQFTATVTLTIGMVRISAYRLWVVFQLNVFRQELICDCIFYLQ